jgi:ADP-heptose:LPS heptosyltransferase
VRIGWVVHDLSEPLVRGHPSVDRVHLWPRARGWRGFPALVRELRAERYGLALDLQRILKSALLARASGAARVLGFDRARSKELSWLLSTERIAPGEPHEHMLLQYARFAPALGLEPTQPVRSLPRDEAAERRAEVFVAEHGVPLVIGVGASKPANRWSPRRFAELAGALRAELGIPLVLTGGPEDRVLFAETLALTAGHAGVHDLVGATSVPELIALLRRACLFVGCDTGPMHLAAAVGTPVVALFGPADPRRTGPWGEEHRVVRAGPGASMDALEVAPVVAAVLESLDERGGAA